MGGMAERRDSIYLFSFGPACIGIAYWPHYMPTLLLFELLAPLSLIRRCYPNFESFWHQWYQ
jgi:hypothetical protein